MKIVLTVFFIWRILLSFISYLSSFEIVPLRLGFLGKIGWDNMDGVHYISIAKQGYFQYEQAFFPGYPLLLRFFNQLVGFDLSWTGFLLSNIFIFLSSLILYKLGRDLFSEKIAIASIIFLYSFPASFFFSAVYTESFFFFLLLSSFYFSFKQKWILAGFFGALASFTRLVGIFLFPALLIEWFFSQKNKHSRISFSRPMIPVVFSLCLIPLGLLAYMYYLYISVGDPFYFFHSQPFFGAGRSGSRLILLPQVIYRYLRIFYTSTFNFSFFIALFEFLFFLLAVYLLLKNIKKIPVSWLVFSFFSLITPTLTGSFSSIPRYFLTIFPLYICLAKESRVVKRLIFFIFVMLLLVGCLYYLKGYFVS